MTRNLSTHKRKTASKAFAARKRNAFIRNACCAVVIMAVHLISFVFYLSLLSVLYATDYDSFRVSDAAFYITIIFILIPYILTPAYLVIALFWADWNRGYTWEGVFLRLIVLWIAAYASFIGAAFTLRELLLRL
jgi:hypothetical protein